MKTITANEDKLKELIVYIASRSEPDQSVGAVKFNKLLFAADFTAYGLYGRPITGVEYQRLPNGPAPRRMIPICEQLIKTGGIVKATRQYLAGGEQHRIVALREADLDQFSASEVDLVNRIIHDFWGYSGVMMSKLSHEFLGWKLAAEGETIPYETVFLARRALTEKESAYAKQLTGESRAAV